MHAQAHASHSHAQYIQEPIQSDYLFIVDPNSLMILNELMISTSDGFLLVFLLLFFFFLVLYEEMQSILNDVATIALICRSIRNAIEFSTQ